LALIQDIGIASGFTTNRVWSLTGVDVPTNKYVGQFEAENLTENVGARLPEVTPIGQQQPTIQFQSGETETITFRARIYRTSPIRGSVFAALGNPVGTTFAALTGNAGPLVGNASVRDQIENLKNLARKNEKIGRPERFIFAYGTEFEFEVFVQSVGGINYDSIRSDGTIRGASFNMQLIKIRPENLVLQAGVSLAGIIKNVAGVVTTIAGGVSGLAALNRDKKINIPGASLHNVSKFVKIKQGDTFEKIARKEYGDALLGDVLRRAQPDKVELKNADQIAIVVRDEAIQIVVTPQSIALRDRAENALLLATFLELRGSPAALIP